MSSRASSDHITLMFQLKGGMYPLLTLQLLGTDLSLFERQLQAKIEQAPQFFQNTPVIVDLQKLPPSASLDFKNFATILIDKKFLPIGVRGGLTQHLTAANLAGLPTIALQETGRDSGQSQASVETTSVSPTSLTDPRLEKRDSTIRSRSKIITEPVRSGQQIYAHDGDLIILAPVSHGSELLADGNIHVYGPLRGRALAGMTGDETAHIFCQNLEAELISIAGQYKISEDIEQSLWRLAVDISLDNGRLHIRPL